MGRHSVFESLEVSPVIAAVREKNFAAALRSPVEVIFFLGADLLTIQERIKSAHEAGKKILVHIDLAEGIGRDKAGVAFLAKCGADGIISTKAGIIRCAKENGLVTVQRFFAYDSQGVDGIEEMLNNSFPDIVEIMPGVIGKIIERFSKGRVPLIAGGLVETKQEVITALDLGALAVSTGKQELWYV